jgi:hypothetical protein
MNTIPHPDQVSGDRRIFNRSAVKEYALECSRKNRGGKFTRVGEEFFREIEADIEAMIREVKNKFPTLHAFVVPPDETVLIVTGELMDVLKRELDVALHRLVQNKVQKQPSCGCTLKNTR